MPINIRRSFNIGRDSFMYGWYKFLINFKLSKPFSLKSYKNCAVLCPGLSLSKINESKNNYDLFILVNFDSKIPKSAKFWQKIYGRPVIIFSSNDEKIVKFGIRKNLNVKAVYSRIVADNILDFKKKRIRRRLEAYGVEVKSLFGYIKNETLENDLQNTGLAAIFFASLNFNHVSIYGMDFYSSNYFSGRKIDFEKLVKKRKHSQSSYSEFLYGKFVNICEAFSHVDFNLYTTFTNYGTVKTDNLHIQKVEIDNSTIH